MQSLGAQGEHNCHPKIPFRDIDYFRLVIFKRNSRRRQSSENLVVEVTLSEKDIYICEGNLKGIEAGY